MYMKGVICVFRITNIIFIFHKLEKKYNLLLLSIVHIKQNSLIIGITRLLFYFVMIKVDSPNPGTSL